MMTNQHEMLRALPGHDGAGAQGRTISDWLGENAQRFGDKTAIEGIGRSALSHAELHGHVLTIGTRLLECGIGRGDVVMISLGNGPEALTTILAVASVAIAFPVMPEEPGDSIGSLLAQVPVKAVLFDANRHSNLRTVGEQRGFLLLPVVIDQTQPAGYFTFAVTPFNRGLPADATRVDDAAIVVKTAGTTAEPKIVAWSQASLYVSANAAATWMGLTPTDRSLCMMPFSHLHSVVRSTMPGLLRGGAAICCPGFDRIRALDWIRDYRPTYMTAVPGIYRAMLSRVAETGWRPEGTSLRFLATGSDSIDRPTVETLYNTFKIPVREFYGMSEVSPMLAATPSGQLAQANGAVGRPLDCWTLGCLNEDGHPVHIGTEGEIVARGAMINPIIGSESESNGRFVNGWFLTGDRGWIDTDGQLHVTGRTDERITRGGKKIAPEAVEKVLAEHPMVQQAVAFPIPDTVLGERVAALVVSTPGSQPAERDLRAFVSERLPDYMVPDRVVVSNTLPENRAGKVVRKGLAKHLGIEADRSTPERTHCFVPRSGTEAVLKELVGGLLEVDRFDLEADFMDLGGDSFGATSLLTAIEERFGILLSPPQFLQNGSVAALARLLYDLSTSTTRPRIFTVQEGNREAPLFLAHGIAGHAYYVNALAKHLGSSQTIYVCQWQEPQLNIEEGLTLEKHAAPYVEAMRAIEPKGPYFLAGHSFGAQLAFEIAQQLWAEGQEVPFLALIDDEADLFKRRYGIAKKTPVSNRVEDLCKHLLYSYVPEAYPGPITLFQAEIKPPVALADPYLGWRDLAIGTIERFEVVGDHLTMMNESLVEHWASLFADHIASAQHQWIRTGPNVSRLAEIRELTQAHRRRPDVQATTLARRAAKSGDLESEIAHYRRAIRLNRNQPYWVFRNFGAALLQHRDIEAALNAFHQAIEHETIPIVGYGLLVEVLRNLGRGKEANQYVQAAASINVNAAHALCTQGDILFRSGAFAHAENKFRRAIALQSEHSHAHRLLSDVLARQNRFDEAIAPAVKAADLNPNFPWFWHQLGKMHAKNGDLQGAKAARRKAIDINPRHPGIQKLFYGVLDHLRAVWTRLAPRLCQQFLYGVLDRLRTARSRLLPTRGLSRFD